MTLRACLALINNYVRPMQLWAYVSHLGREEQLDWGGNHSGNIPVDTSGRPQLDSTAFWKIQELAKNGSFHGRQVDWGAWALKVNGDELLGILTEAYGEKVIAEPGPRLKPYVILARELGAHGYVAFVAAEL